MRLGSDKLGLLSAVLVLVIATISTLIGEPEAPPQPPAGQSVRRPPPPPGVDGSGLRQFSIEAGVKKDSRGTAFSVGDGVLMTARHVVDGCDRIGVLNRAGRFDLVREVLIHPNADVAIVRLRDASPSVPLADEVPKVGDLGYSVGYPRGKPGELHARMIGMRVMNAHGRYTTRERVIAWAEIARNPNELESLGGLSGGPVFDPLGRVVGVLVAESRRRGRSYSAHPDSIRYMMQQADVTGAVRRADIRFSPATQLGVANALRAERTVALALCDVL